MKNLEEIFISSAIAQTDQPTSPSGKAPGGMAGLLMPMLLVFVIFYFLMIRPQAKQQKKHKELVANLKKGDDVVTTAGIHGRVAGIAEGVVTLEVADNVRIKMDRTQVAQVKQSAAA